MDVHLEMAPKLCKYDLDNILTLFGIKIPL